MTMKIKTLSAVTILSAAVVTPVFAQSTHHGRVHDLRNFRGVYNQFNGPSYAAPPTLDRLAEGTRLGSAVKTRRLILQVAEPPYNQSDDWRMSASRGRPEVNGAQSK
jgi:hypothetical protein